MQLAEEYFAKHQRKFSVVDDDSLMAHCPKCSAFQCIIRRKTWAWRCAGCDATGDAYRWKQLDGAVYSISAIAEDPEPLRRMREVTSPLVLVWRAQLWAHERAERAREYLMVDRRIKRSVLEQANVGWAFRNPAAAVAQSATITPARPGAAKHDNDNGFITIPVYRPPSEGTAIADFGTLDLLKFRSVPPASRVMARVADGRSSLYVPGILWTFEPLMIVGGELDALSVLTANHANVVSMTTGENSIHPSVLETLKGIEQIIIALDNDDAGRRGAEQLAERLGRQRCAIATWPSDYKDANECLVQQGELQMEQTIKQMIASAVPCAGDDVIKVSSLAERIIAHTHERREARSWGLGSDFDALVGGRRRGELSVWTGDTGSGKSTVLSFIALQIAAQANEGVLMIPLELGAVRQSVKWLRQYAGKPPKAMTDDEIKQHMKAMGNMRLWLMNRYGDLDAERLQATIEYAVERLGITVVILDHLNFATDGAATPDKLATINAMMKMLAAAAVRLNIEVNVVAHPKATNGPDKDADNKVIQMAHIKDSSAIKQDADNVFSVFVKRASNRENIISPDGYGRTFIYSLKMRDDDAQEGAVTLRFKPQSATYHPDHVAPDRSAQAELPKTWHDTIEGD